MKNKVYRSGDSLVRQMRDTKVPDDAIGIWYLGQEGFFIKTESASILIDPYLTDSVDRLPEYPSGFWVREYDSPVCPDRLDFVDYVLCTHDHVDHMDPATIRGINSVNKHAEYIVPVPSVDLMKKWGIDEDRIIGAKASEKIELKKDIYVFPAAAAHTEFHRDINGEYAELSYVVQLGDFVIFHGGDMVLYPGLIGFLSEFKIDIAFLPINGGDYFRTSKNVIGNCGFREAADLGYAVGADLVVPMHFGLYSVNTENPAYFVDYHTCRYPNQKFHIFKPGERLIYFNERLLRCTLNKNPLYNI